MTNALTRTTSPAITIGLCLVTCAIVRAGEDDNTTRVVVKPGLFTSLTEPPCSYCSTQHRKGLIRDDDRVIAWLRGAHNGGAVPIRHFLAGPRVINDTYGLFFYDPDGGYVAAYQKDYGYRFHGWRRGVMTVQGPDGSLWSALSGTCFDGPRQGQRLTRIPSMVTAWDYWLMLHPESTAYDLFDGQTYKVTPLPDELSPEARETMGRVDSRRMPTDRVLGVEVQGTRKAYPLDGDSERACVNDVVDGQPIGVFWYGPTQSAVAFHRELDGQTLTFYTDSISPESAPIKDRETGTRWTLAGRGVDGPLQGKELRWIDSVACRWYAWVAEHAETQVHQP